MEAHAVPQEIMGMEFKLFGNFLTLKEFVYIAIGVGVSYILYFMMQNGLFPPILGWPAILILGVGGIVTALVPIQDRTLDKWIINYIKAIRSPTQRVWKKKGFDPTITVQMPGVEQTGTISAKHHIVTPPESPTSIQQQKSPAQAMTFQAAQKVDQQETQELNRLNQVMQETLGEGNGPLQQTQQSLPQQPTTPQTQPPATVSPEPAQQVAQQPVSQTPAHQPQPTQQPATPPQTPTQPVTATSEPTVLQQPDPQNPTPAPQSQPTQSVPQPVPPTAQTPAPAQPPQPPAQTPPSITINNETINQYATEIPGIQPKPNTLNLAIKDKDDKMLSQVVCVIKTEAGNPVRAAVSNNLGHVENNITLHNGIYTLELSKQGFKFPTVTANLTGKTYPPIEIKSL